MEPSPIAALIARMAQFPDEFINPDWTYRSGYGNTPHPYLYNTRWGSAIGALLADPTCQELLTAEETKALKDGLNRILRARIEGEILKELVGGEERDKLEEARRQKEMFYKMGQALPGHSNLGRTIPTISIYPQNNAPTVPIEPYK